MKKKEGHKYRRENSKKLNICLLLPESFDPNMPARPAVTEIYGVYLPSFGHKVTWITPSIDEKSQEFFFKEVKVYAVPCPAASSLPLKIINLILYLIKEYKLLNGLLKEDRYDLIQARDHVFEALLALHIKRKYNIPFVFQYTFPVEDYKLYRNDPEKRYLYYFGKIENYIIKYILRKADLIFPISKWMEEGLVKQGIPELKMMPLPMGVNPELFSQNKDGTKIRKKYDLNDTEVILYTGTMDKLRQLGVIIRAFSKVREHKDNAKLLMVGEGNDKPNLEELASKLGIQDDVIFTGQVPYFDVPDYIAAADICLCPVHHLDIYKVSSPTKLFEYMVMKKPVVANKEIPEQREVIRESEGGILVKFEAESFANGITELLDDLERAKEMGRKGHEWVVKNRSYEIMAREVEKRYFVLLSKVGTI